jgi:hypothetical protein
MDISGIGASGHLTSRPGARRGADCRLASPVEMWRWKTRCSHIGSVARVRSFGNVHSGKRTWEPDWLRASEGKVLTTVSEVGSIAVARAPFVITERLTEPVGGLPEASEKLPIA